MSRGKHLKIGKAGFTIVELLIVVVVIAILAAITIVAYNGISTRAKQSAVQSATAQAVRKITADAVLNGDTYTSNPGDLGLVDSNGVSYQYTVNNDTSPKGFCITATNSNISAYASKSFSYNGGSVLDQATSVFGACPGHVAAGQTAVTNLISNPSFETVGTAGWTASSGSNIALSTVGAASGVNSIRVTNTGTTNIGDARLNGGGLNSFFPGMEAGKTYTMSARVTIPVAPTGSLARAPGILMWYSLNGVSYVESHGPKAPASAGTYTVSHTFTIPATALGAIMGLGGASTTTGQVFYYDSVILTEGSTPYAYADGSTPGWVWTGPVGNSTSRGPAQ